MAKKKEPQREDPAGDFMEVGKEVVPGMRLRCICRRHTGTIGRIAWSPCERFIASPSQDETIRIWDAERDVLTRRCRESSLSSTNVTLVSPDGVPNESR